MVNFLTISRVCFISVCLFSSLPYARASVDQGSFPGRLPTFLSRAEVLREVSDEKTYPHFMAYLKGVSRMGNLRAVDPRNAGLIKSTHYFDPTPELWNGFFKAAAADHLTCLRAFVLLAREVKKNGIVVFGPGNLFEEAVKNNHVDLGLAIPAHNLGAAVWTPDPKKTDPEFLVHIKIFYTESFVHQFPDEVLPANMKVGFNQPENYWLGDKEYSQPSVEADLYYGPIQGVGFRNVKGIGGQKRGLLGFFQKVLFFLPDAIDSMTIHEDKGEMVTEALVNTSVKDFETKPIYAIKIKSQ